jgi:HK97 family phage major capsid protein
MVHAVEHERGVNPEWFMPRGVLADVQGLVSASTGTPIFNPVPIGQGHGWTLLGYPINIVSVMDNTPDDGCIRMAFGDPSQYIIMMRGGVVIQWNPYVSMKEGMTQVIGLTRADGNVVAADAWTIMQRND